MSSTLHVRVLRGVGLIHEDQPPLRSAVVVLWLAVTFSQQVAALALSGGVAGAQESVCMTVAVASLSLQLAYVRTRGAALQALVRDAGDVDALLEERHPRLCAPLHQHRRVIARISRGLYAMVALVCVSWTLVPVALVPGGAFALPLEAWFPRWWPFTLAYLDLTLVFAFYSPVYIGLNAVLIDAVSQLSSKMRILVHLIDDITPSPSSSSDDVDVDARERIVECVQLHQRILKLHQQLEAILSPLLVVKFSSGILNIVQSSLPAVLEGEFSNSMLKNLAFAVVISFEILTYCYYGEQLVDCSEKVNSAAYNSLWYLLDRQCKILLKIVMLQTTRTMHISIGKMYKLTLRTFKEMMNVMYALFTIMRQASM